MNKPSIAIRAIRLILEDDGHYSTDELKLGAIWNFCDWAASYRRLDTTDGGAVEVIPHTSGPSTG